MCRTVIVLAVLALLAACTATVRSQPTKIETSGVSVTLVSPGFVESEIRQVDNTGVYRRDAPDPVPAWLIMPTTRAARQIVRAVARRRHEVVITGHGKLAVFLQRHVPWLVRAGIRATGARSRREPERPSGPS